MEKKAKNTLIFAGITLMFIFGITGLVYADEGKCPKLSNYVEHTYFIHDEMENNFVEFDISVDKQSGYLFCWDDVSENNTEFMKFLKDKFDIVLVAENGTINKKGDEINFTFNVKNNATIKRFPMTTVRYEFESVKNNNVATVTMAFKLNKTKKEVTLEEITNGINIFKHIIEKDKNKNILTEHVFRENIREKYLLKEENGKRVYLADILVPIYVYIDKPFVQQMFVINLTQKDNDGRYSDHVRLNLRDTIVSEIYLNRPGIHTLLITTDAHYYSEDISNLCDSPYPCNALPHPCSKSDRILKHIKVISKDKHYGIIYKLIGLKNINEDISYLEKPITTGNFTEEYNWKLFLLSNSSALKLNDEHTKEVTENATETTKKFTSAVVVEGTVYDKDANPVKGAEVGVYIVGIEPYVIHIMTITDEEGKFKIYHEPAGQYIYRLPKIEAFNPNDKFDDELYYGVVYSGLSDSVDMNVLPKSPPEEKEPSFPIVETLIIGVLIGAFLTLFGTGYLTKIIDAFKGRKKEEYKGAH